MAGDEHTGVSIMRLTAGLDSGPVCLTESEPIAADDDFGSLAARLSGSAENCSSARSTLRRRRALGFCRAGGAPVTYAEKIGPDDRVLDPESQRRDWSVACALCTPTSARVSRCPTGHCWACSAPRWRLRQPRAARAYTPRWAPSARLRRRFAGVARGAAARQAADGSRGVPARPRPAGGLMPKSGDANVGRVQVRQAGARAQRARPTRKAPVAPARRCAYAVVRRVFEQGAYADRALQAEAQSLDARDRALAMRLAYGAIQRRATLDHVLERLADRPAERLTRPVLAALRLGLYELLYLSGAPDHAVVADCVELAKSGRGSGHGLVNAVLRRAAREGAAELLGDLREDTPEHAAIAHSHPAWIARMWWQDLGPARRARADGRRQRARRAGAARQHSPAPSRRRRGRAGGRPPTPTQSCPRRWCWMVRSTCTAPALGGQARSSPNRARRCLSPMLSTPSPASVCLTCAPRPAARAHISLL